MKILADENISLLLVKQLRQEGHQVECIVELAPSEEIEIVTNVISTYGDQLLRSFTVIMPRGVRIRPM